MRSTTLRMCQASTRASSNAVFLLIFSLPSSVLISPSSVTAIPRLNEDPRSCVDTGGQVDSGVVDDSPRIFVRSGTRRTDSGRAGWPCGAPGGAAGERDCSFERRLELRGGRVGAFAGRRHGARVVRGLSETGHGGIEEFRP